MEENTTPQTPAPVESNNEVTPPPHKPMLMHIVMGLTILLVGFGGGWYMGIRTQTAQTNQTTPSPTPSPEASDEMEGWKTYRDEKNGYELKYPNNPFVRLLCPNENLLLIQRGLQTKDVVDMMNNCARDGRYDFEIVIKDQSTQEPTSNEYFTVTKTPIIIGGISGQKYQSVANKTEGFPGAGSQHNEVIFEKNNNYYHIFGSFYTAPYLDQILSTFEFVDKTR